MHVFNLARRLDRKAVVSAAANGAASALDLVSFVLLARILDAGELGIFLIALMVGAATLRVGSPNFVQIFMRHAARAIDQQKPRDLKFILDVGAVCDGFMLVFALVMGVCAALLLPAGGGYADGAAVLGAVLLSSLKPQVLSIAVPRAFGHHDTLYLWMLIGAALKVVLLLVAMGLKAGLAGVVAAFAVWQIVPAVRGLLLTLAEARSRNALYVRRSTLEAFRTRHADLPMLIRNGSLAVLPQIVFDLATPIVGVLGGVGNAGLFGLAVKIGQAARIYGSPVSFVLYSKQCSDVEAGNGPALVRHTLAWAAGLGLVTACGAAVFWLVDETVVVLAFGADFIDAVDAVQWCLVAAIPTTAGMPLQFGLMALGRADRVLHAETAGALLFVGLVAATSGQATDAAVSLAAARLVAFAVSLYGLVRERPARPGPRRVPPGTELQARTSVSRSASGELE